MSITFDVEVVPLRNDSEIVNVKQQLHPVLKEMLFNKI